MGALLRRYSRWNERSPLIAVPVSTGIILGAGDVLCQGAEQLHPVKRNVSTQMGSKVAREVVEPPATTRTTDNLVPFRYDAARMLRMAFYGWFCFGPFCALWYTRWLPRLVPMKEPALKLVLLKVALDETLQSWFFYTSFLYTMTRLEGSNHEDALAKLRKDFWKLYSTDLMLWPWVQFINFWWVPPHLQSLVVSSVSVLWGAFLSSVQNESPVVTPVA